MKVALVPELKLSLVSGGFSPINFIQRYKSLFIILDWKTKQCFVEWTQDIESLKCSSVHRYGGDRQSNAFHSSVGLDWLHDKPIMKCTPPEDGNLQFAQERERKSLSHRRCRGTGISVYARQQVNITMEVYKMKSFSSWTKWIVLNKPKQNNRLWLQSSVVRMKKIFILVV